MELTVANCLQFLICCHPLTIAQTFYVRDNGVDIAVVNAIEAIVSCLRSEDGFCTSPPDEGQSLKSLGF